MASRIQAQSEKLSERWAIEVICQREQVSVSQLAGELELSPSTTVGILGRLLDKGSLTRREAPQRRRGRPTFHYELKLPAPLACFLFDATQLAGTIFGSAFDVQASEVLQVAQVRSREDAVEMVQGMLARLCGQAAVAKHRLYGAALSVNAVRTRGSVYTSSVLPWVDAGLASVFARELGVPTHLISHPQLLAEYRLLPEPRPRSMLHLHAADGVSAHWSSSGTSLGSQTHAPFFSILTRSWRAANARKRHWR